MYAFLRSPRWIIGTLVAIVVTLGCIRLGFWQLDRLEQKRTYNALVSQRMRQPPVGLDELLDEASDTGSLAYRRVIATGFYERDAEFLLFGRPLDEQPGSHVFTPLALISETSSELAPSQPHVVIVRRGWVPFELDTAPVAQATPPEGIVTIDGVLVPSDAGDARPLIAENGTLVRVSQVNLAQIETALDLGEASNLVPYSLWLQEQDPAQPGALPRPVPLPTLDEGSHFSYAVQWFIFAAIALGGWLILIRREAKGRPPAEHAAE